MKIQMRQAVKLKMQVYIAGSEYMLSPGDVTERFSDAEAIRLIEKGYAVPVAETEIETAVLPPPTETRDEPMAAIRKRPNLGKGKRG